MIDYLTNISKKYVNWLGVHWYNSKQELFAIL